MATPPSWQEQQTPLQQWQRNLFIDSDNASTTRARTPDWWQAIRATTLAWQRQRCLCINNSNDAITTMAKMPAHWQWWWCHCFKGNNASLTNNRQLMCTFFLAGSFLEKNRFVLTFPTRNGRSGWRQFYWFQGDTNNCVCHCTGWMEVASPPEGERATLTILVWPKL